MQNITTIALSRLAAQQRAMDVTATNIANAATQGFQAERMVFADWLVRQPAGAEPQGGQTLAYTQDRATYRDPRPGPMTRTGNPLDLAIGDPEGFLTVQTANGPRLTRAGHFELSAAGTVVDTDGNALLGAQGRPIQVSPADGQISITADGTVSGQNGPLGRIAVVRPASAQSLRPEGGRLFATDQPTTPAPAPASPRAWSRPATSSPCSSSPA